MCPEQEWNQRTFTLREDTQPTEPQYDSLFIFEQFKLRYAVSEYYTSDLEDIVLKQMLNAINNLYVYYMIQ